MQNFGVKGVCPFLEVIATSQNLYQNTFGVKYYNFAYGSIVVEGGVHPLDGSKVVIKN